MQSAYTQRFNAAHGWHTEDHTNLEQPQRSGRHGAAYGPHPQTPLHHHGGPGSYSHVPLQVAAAVFAFRGTKLNKAGNLRADLHLLQDLNAEMIVTQRATKKVQNHIRRLQEQFQSVRWSFYTTGMFALSAHKACASDMTTAYPSPSMYLA